MFYHGNLKDYYTTETITPYATSYVSLTPLIDYYVSKVRVKFTGSCLKQPKLSYTHGKVVNIYIVSSIILNTKIIDITMKSCFVFVLFFSYYLLTNL